MGEFQHAQPDRRVHARVRAVFPQACVLLGPVIWAVRENQVSDFALTRIVRDQFPEISSFELEILVWAVRHYYGYRCPL